MGGGDDDVENAEDLDWVCDRVEVDSTEAAGDPAEEPEGAITEMVDGAQLVDAFRSDDEVLFAWVDEDGEAVQSHTVTRVDGGWVTSEIQTCQD